jgi:hypothetical protein
MNAELTSMPLVEDDARDGSEREGEDERTTFVIRRRLRPPWVRTGS